LNFSHVTVKYIDRRCLIRRPSGETEQLETGENWAMKKLITCIKEKSVRWGVHIAYMGGETRPYRKLVGRPKREVDSWKEAVKWTFRNGV
jgi:hypothetical protein